MSYFSPEQNISNEAHIMVHPTKTDLGNNHPTRRQEIS